MNSSATKPKNIYYNLIKGMVIGVLLIVGACWFWWSLTGNIFHELALIRRAQITSGTLIEVHEHEEEDFRGHVYFSDIGVYVYQLSDGREFRTTIREPTGQLKKHREVEYLPEKPEISRIKGDGCQSITEWLWRKIGLGGIILVLFLSIGCIIIKNTIIEFMREQKDKQSKLLDF